MANFFIKRPIFAIVVALVVSIAGLLAVFSLPGDHYPRIHRLRFPYGPPIPALMQKS